MFNVGMTELLIILVVALIVLGPQRLPEIATGLGKAIRDFKKATRDLQTHIDADETVSKPLQELRAALRDEPAPSATRPLAAPPATVPAVAAAAPAAAAPAAPAPAAASAEAPQAAETPKA
jgi:TatA/E family protein of Tat protein translocase